MLESFNKKQKLIFFIIVGIMICIILYYIYTTLYQNKFSLSVEEDPSWDNEDDFVQTNSTDTLEDTANTKSNTIVVYICGAVKESKVITLKENSRITDAIEAVGGLESDADLTNINLAYMLEDGEKIYIPRKGETTNENIESDSPISSTSTKSTKININKATQAELETIPGVGPSTALKIINYRKENGKFKTIEEIKNVSGIGDAKFEKMKPYIII